MKLTRRVALNGKQLDNVDDRIVISSVEPGDGRENITAVDAASGYGQRVTGNRRSTLDMVVKFRILEHGHTKSGMQGRAEVLEKVNAWAAEGGVLTVNYKPERRLNVILAQAPGEGSLWDYTKEYTMTFRAYAIPYWEQENAQSITFGGSSATGNGTAAVDGSAKTQLKAELYNNSGKEINTATVRIGPNVMEFTNLALAGAETLVIDHTSNGLVRIRIRSASGGYRSAMAARSTSSANDFMVTPGNIACSYTAQRACRLTVSWRARYL